MAESLTATEKKFKILAIDGGGIRGIMPAKILCEMEACLAKKEGVEKRLCDYFDLICGTSTGGIIAVALGLGIPARDILNLYKENAARIFPSSRWVKWKNLFRTGTLYTSEYLYGQLKQAFSEVISGREPLLGDCKTRVLVPVYNAAKGTIHVLKTPHHQELKRDYLIPAADVAIATASAPIYFKPHSFRCDSLKDEGEYQYLIDGAVFANNPALLGLLEAHRSLAIPYPQIMLLSLGTGTSLYREKSRRRRFGPLYWLNPFSFKLYDLFSSAQSVHTDNLLKFINRGIGETGSARFYYQRLQQIFEYGKEIRIDESDPTKLNELVRYGQMLFQEHIPEIRRFLAETKGNYMPEYSF